LKIFGKIFGTKQGLSVREISAFGRPPNVPIVPEKFTIASDVSKKLDLQDSRKALTSYSIW
jgi:hypothetical protein